MQTRNKNKKESKEMAARNYKENKNNGLKQKKAVYGTQAYLTKLLDLAARVTIKMANIRTKKVLKKNGEGSKTKVLDERILKW